MLAIKSYNCERCGNDFASPTALKQHFLAKHLGKVYCDKCGTEVCRAQIREHEQVVHEKPTTETKHQFWDRPLQRATKFVSSETCVTCRMCHKEFGTIHGREQHERQDHHFTASKRAVKRNLYCRLYNCGDNEEIQLHSISLLQYQVDFVKVSTVGVKDLIRLIKHWLKTSFADFSEENRFRKLPSSYAIELIVIYVWQLAGKPILFSLVQGLRAVLKLLVRYLEVCIVWYEHYDSRFQILKKTIQKQTRPFVLDPVNPTFNVCENSNAWDEVAHVARNSLLKPLLNGVQAKEPWLFTNDW
nr:PREDICTED: 2'-5'-oligoadenylate synthase 2-like isoform X1 [Latimeria chalumnae]XP_014353846.1 PREDICTED: 2'-5'-oligoadenylate synthase 2-like isoform X1 [Latimeria chalumnae]|eukprot:XP_006012121.1 PREDICTED: 2'-5'-oligoadenylate synthase 2-like isoform X1 [Latimeria chalumnae]